MEAVPETTEIAPGYSSGTKEMPPGHDPAAKAIPGLALLDINDLDKRTKPYRRWEAIRAAVLLDRGGEANVSEVQRQLISKFATLALQLELLEIAALAGQAIDCDLFGRVSGHLRRLGETLGVDRVPHDIGPSLADLIRMDDAAQRAAKAAAKAAAAATTIDADEVAP